MNIVGIFFAAVIFLMAGAGFLVILQATLPQRLFSVMFGKGSYETSPRSARILGLFMMLPLFAGMAGPYLGTLGIINPAYLGCFYVGLFIVVAFVTIYRLNNIKDSNER